MFRIVRTDKTIEVFKDAKRIFLTTIGDGEFGTCSKSTAEDELQEFLRRWNVYGNA